MNGWECEPITIEYLVVSCSRSFYIFLSPVTTDRNFITVDTWPHSGAIFLCPMTWKLFLMILNHLMTPVLTWYSQLMRLPITIHVLLDLCLDYRTWMVAVLSQVLYLFIMRSVDDLSQVLYLYHINKYQMQLYLVFKARFNPYSLRDTQRPQLHHPDCLFGQLGMF